MNQRQLEIAPGIWGALQQHLFTQDRAENFAFGLAQPQRRRWGILYQVQRIIASRQLDYEGRSCGGLTMSRAASNQMNAIARDAAAHGLVPIHLHSHPPGCDDFSGYDDAHESKLHQWLRGVEQPLLLSLVVPYGGTPVARLWVEGQPQPLAVRVGLQPISGFDGGEQAQAALDRQRAFGRGLGAAASALSVAIVGTGGIGMLVAEQLARCGFRSFVLVDPDTIDLTNLNRLNGAFASDLGQRKVVVAARLIRQCASALGTEATIRLFADDIYTAPRRVAEMVRQCDLVIALTDDHNSRLRTLMMAMEGSCEFLSAGVDIRIADGKIEGLYAEIVGGERDRFCPVCAGRLDPAQASIEARRYVGGIVTEHARRAGYIPDVPAPSVMSLNSTAAGMLVLEIQRRVSGLGQRDLVQVDWQSGTVKTIERGDEQLKNGCGVCGRVATRHTEQSQRQLFDEPAEV